MRKTLFLLCVVFLSTSVFAKDVWDGTSVATAYSDGNGTKEQPYLISTAAELAYLSEMVNGETAMDYANTYFKLMGDIDLDGYEWLPIGKDRANRKFKGNFDGNGYLIHNLNVNNPSGFTDFGLFGYIENDTIQNLGIAGNSRVYSNMVNSGTGGIVGSCYSPSGGRAGAILNCFSNATVISDQHCAGGIVGGLYGRGVRVYVLNCYSTGDVAGNTSGGVVGSTGSQNKITITNCYTTGNIDTISVEGKIAKIGTVANYANATLTLKTTNCYYVDDIVPSIVNVNDASMRKTVEEMKTADFVTVMNGDPGSGLWKADYAANDGGNINQGYPILHWQKSNSGQPNAVADTKLLQNYTIIVNNQKLIIASELNRQSDIAVFSLSGSCLYKGVLNSELSIDGLDKGVYILSIESEGKGAARKVQIN